MASKHYAAIREREASLVRVMNPMHLFHYDFDRKISANPLAVSEVKRSLS